MRIIHCSQNLLKEIKEDVVSPEDIPADNSGLGNWYCDVFRYNRKKYLIFTNERTLYTFFVYGIKRHDVDSISNIFRENLLLYLNRTGIDNEIINRVTMEYKEIGFCRGSNSNITETMNFFIKMLEARLECIDDITEREILITNMNMNTTELEQLDFSYPAKKIKELITKNYSAGS